MTSEAHEDTRSEQTTVGNYFVANYPPFSFWKPEHVPAVGAVLQRPPDPATPFGIYLHIPFCRKRCDFCYYKVYTDRAASEIRRYLDAVVAEAGRYAGASYLKGRAPRFLYFGGGTPSYLSVSQLKELWSGLRSHFDHGALEEVTFECEPGTLQESKIEALRELGVTRLSLGIENFDAQVLESGNRAHGAEEIYRAYAFARKVGFAQINVDLIAGMVGETEANWRRCIEKTIELDPDYVTIYQMEIPYNTTIYQRMKEGRDEVAPVADWPTKRRWVAEAFERLEAAGYTVSSSTTVQKHTGAEFLYRKAQWFGADLLGLGVSSFSHLGGVHFQNEKRIEEYLERVERGERPVQRALPLSADERLVREFVLQLKLGQVERRYFRRKFGVDAAERFRAVLERLAAAGFLSVENERIVVRRDGLLQIDRLLPEFFRPEHQHARYA